MVSLEIAGHRFFAPSYLDATALAIAEARDQLKRGNRSEARTLYETALAKRRELGSIRVR